MAQDRPKMPQAIIKGVKGTLWLSMHAQWRFRVGGVPKNGYKNTWACFVEQKWEPKNNDFAWEVLENFEKERCE